MWPSLTTVLAVLVAATCLQQGQSQTTPPAPPTSPSPPPSAKSVVAPASSGCDGKTNIVTSTLLLRSVQPGDQKYSRGGRGLGNWKYLVPTFLGKSWVLAGTKFQCSVSRHESLPLLSIYNFCLFQHLPCYHYWYHSLPINAYSFYLSVICDCFLLNIRKWQF